jgi:hypothetical protein
VNKPLDRWALERTRKAAGLVRDHGVSVGPVPSRLAVGAVTVAIAVGGCGHDAGAPDPAGGSVPRTQDERLATQRVQAFLSAMERRDDARACATMTSGLRRGITENLRSDALPGNFQGRRPPCGPGVSLSRNARSRKRSLISSDA